MSRELDLDKLRAAREEAEGPGPKHVLYGGEKFELPSEPPWDFGIALAQGRTDEALRLLLGDPDYDRFMAHRPSTLDVRALMEHLDDLYPGSSGEGSAASRKSSARTTPKPRPTSSGSTG